MASRRATTSELVRTTDKEFHPRGAERIGAGIGTYLPGAEQGWILIKYVDDATPDRQIVVDHVVD